MSNLLIEDEFSFAYLQKELLSLESSLADLEQKKQALDREADGSQFIDRSQEDEEGKEKEAEESEKPAALRWNELAQQADALILAQDISDWMKDFSNKAKQDGGLDILLESEMCTALGELILKYTNILEVAPQIYGEYYLVLYDYCHGSLVQLLRGELTAHRYPSNCRKLIKLAKRKKKISMKTKSPVVAICKQLSLLEESHHFVLRMIEGWSEPQPVPIVLAELFAPIVQRVRFHFVEEAEERITSTRVDRLPELLLTYLREHVLQDKGPMDLAMILLKDAAGDSAALLFLNELVQLVQWVFDARNFFRHPAIAGPQSNPMLLYSAMEHLVRFDKALQQSLPPSSSESDNVLMMGCMDLLVGTDEDLMDWWIQRERESMFATLLDEGKADEIPKPLPNYISARAEVFSALIRSTQYKASVLQSPGRYLREVAVPLCTRFVDALHERVNQLKRKLLNYSNTRIHDSFVAPQDELRAAIFEWIETINGIRLASDLLGRQDAWQEEDSAAASPSDHDLSRFGRSLEQLNQVMIDEFLISFVETIVLEQAKCASYIMMAQHLLASQEWEEDGSELSLELIETKSALEILRTVCNEVIHATEDLTGTPQAPSPFAFAAVVIQEQVMERLAHNFMEVAMDVHSMTPEIWQTGSQVFARDVQQLFAGAPFPLCQRLLDVVALMTMEHKLAHGLFLALAGLTGTQTLLMQEFANDERLFDEAVSMIRAKGFNRLELPDAISILSRRRD